MARWSRKVLGSVVTTKTGTNPVIKMNDDVVLKKGEYLNLENKTFQLEKLQDGVTAGRVNESLRQEILSGINKIPWKTKGTNGEEDTGFVLFQVVKVTKNE